jgi:Na+-transporting methylmalonyl-CoA/oxaloacetate decarboxylase gamma subunit
MGFTESLLSAFFVMFVVFIVLIVLWLLLKAFSFVIVRIEGSAVSNKPAKLGGEKL